MPDATETTGEAMIAPVTAEIIDQKELAQQLLEQTKEQGVSLVGPGGLLARLTASMLETALDTEETRAPRPRAQRHPGGLDHAQRAAAEDHDHRDRDGKELASIPFS